MRDLDGSIFSEETWIELLVVKKSIHSVAEEKRWHILWRGDNIQVSTQNGWSEAATKSNVTSSLTLQYKRWKAFKS